MPQLSNVNWNFSMMVMIFFLLFVNFLIHYNYIFSSNDGTTFMNIYYKVMLNI